MSTEPRVPTVDDIMAVLDSPNRMEGRPTRLCGVSATVFETVNPSRLHRPGQEPIPHFLVVVDYPDLILSKPIPSSDPVALGKAFAELSELAKGSFEKDTPDVGRNLTHEDDGHGVVRPADHADDDGRAR